MSSKKLYTILFLMSVLVFLMCSAESCDQQCDTCVADPFAKQDSSGNWVAQPTASSVEKVVKQVETKVQQGNDAVGKYVSPSVAPAGKQLIESIGAGNTSKMLNDFAERCGRFGGQVANVNVATLGCYK